MRETKDHLTGKSRAQINFKGKKLDDRTMTREELETEVEDGAVCRNILQAIGYMPAELEVIKDRTMLQKGCLTACLDNVHALGEFLELEILADSEDEREAALERIENILNSLGYQISDTVRTSYLSMLQNRKQTGGQYIMTKEIEREHKMKVYGSEICVDCRNFLVIRKARGFDCDFIEITEDTGKLKEFLHLRDTEPIFEPVREHSGIGIPLFVNEDGRMTFDLDEALSWIGQAPVQDGEQALLEQQQAN